VTVCNCTCSNNNTTTNNNNNGKNYNYIRTCVGKTDDGAVWGRILANTRNMMYITCLTQMKGSRQNKIRKKKPRNEKDEKKNRNYNKNFKIARCVI